MFARLKEHVLGLRPIAESLLLRAKVRTLELIIVGAYVGTLFALGASVQQASYGVLLLGLSMAFVIFLVSWHLEDHPDQVKELALPGLLDRRFRYMAAAFLLPLVLSWLENEGVMSALSPGHYWKAEAVSVGEQCDRWNSIVGSSADSLRVQQNKYDMGIATVNELKSSIDSFKLMADLRNKCVDEQTKRRKEISAHLKRLALDKVVLVR